MNKTNRKTAQEQKKHALQWLMQVAGRYKLAVAGIALLDAVLGASSAVYALLFGNLVNQAAAGRLKPFLWAAAMLAVITLAQMILETVDSLL